MSFLCSWGIIAERMIFWFIHIPIISLLAYQVFLRVNKGIGLKVYTTALLLKLLAGLTVGWIFHYYYGQGDTIVFFEEANEIATLPLGEYVQLLVSPSNYQVASQPRVLFFTKFLSFFLLISGGSYWLASLYLSLISFVATWFLVVTLIKLIPEIKVLSLISFFFIPTIVFWSSGILKDSLAFSAIAFIVAIILKLFYKEKLPVPLWVIGLISVFVLFKIKHYLLISVILFSAGIPFMLLISKSSTRFRIIAIVIFLGATIATQFIHPYLKFDRLTTTLYENNQAIYEKTDPEDKIELKIESPKFVDVLKEVPLAIQLGLLRPALFDRTSNWGWLHRVENTVLALLMILSLVIAMKERPYINHYLVIPALLSILMLAIMLALSTPNFGTLVRYKNAFLPFLFLLCSILPYRYFIVKKP